MGFTQAEMAFVGAHETGINDLITAFCQDRPRYLLYRSPAFGPAPTIDATRLDPIAFPGIPGGIEWQVKLTIPQIDLFDQDMPLPPELSLSPGQFSARLGIEICLDCKPGRIRQKDHREEKDPRKEHPLREVTCWRVEVFAVGHIEPTLTSAGGAGIALVVDKLEVVEIRPDELETLIECLLFMIIQAALAQIVIPVETFAFDPFTPAVGPLIEDDQVKLRGNM